jgi:3-hydroxyacyl-[acyl-carrier-protein] dehydratase
MMNLDTIKSIIPHRDPFILIESITYNESLKTTTATKLVRMTDFWVPGHFPGEPLMPGVLIVEALAQTAAINVLTNDAYQGKIGYFASIQEARFKRKVIPGDALVLTVNFLHTRSGFFFYEGTAYVNDVVVCQALFSVAVGSK